ncbi:hypothetical protein [Mycobacterium marinum]|uniref:hypothetical protein n=1 Tax=Mycobacterium marinum TaxID=1781 RepID=UPI0021C30D32|nr:hypothetical protein [Mycobacterium marinum]
MHAGVWAALAQWATVGVATVAAKIALSQVNVARATRERVAQPDVVAYIEQNAHNWHYMDFVIKNFGQTTAYNIRLSLPPLAVVPYYNQVTGEHVTSLYVPETIAVLAPGQEWRTVWDSAIERNEYKHELQSQFPGHIYFDDKMLRPKQSYSNPVSLDTDMFINTIRITTEKAQNPEKALYEIADILKGYKKRHEGIWVYAVPGHVEEQYYQNLSARLKEIGRRTNRALRGKRDKDTPSDPPTN